MAGRESCPANGPSSRPSERGGRVTFKQRWMLLLLLIPCLCLALLVANGISNPPSSATPLTGGLPADRANSMRDRYLDVLRDALTGAAFRTTEMEASQCWLENKKKQKESTPLSLCPPMDPEKRRVGVEWPVLGLTMIGTLRMNNLRELLERVERERVVGDFMECGVWRGGAAIFAQAVLSSAGIDRHVWLADSFEGLPLPRTPSLSKDGKHWNKMAYFQVSMEEVLENFKAFGLYHPERLHFCKGYFVDSLPHCHPSKIAVLRMDGDMYESTMDQLFNLYPLVSLGGFVIVDDWNVEHCQRAVTDFWEWHGLLDEVAPVGIDPSSLYWQKTREVSLQWQRYEALLPQDNQVSQRK